MSSSNQGEKGRCFRCGLSVNVSELQVVLTTSGMPFQICDGCYNTQLGEQ